ncbi:hypothetical protein SITYG_09500 [Streptococcus intermedius]|uniref:Uncharacterized protein n=1 Tax=Streptococcus intermedius TaxID=1338 RepID=A0AAD1C7Y1_STRIT|nr:hypothetical protein SITYG_09500 [Streptococcus intermedius]
MLKRGLVSKKLSFDSLDLLVYQAATDNYYQKTFFERN